MTHTIYKNIYIIIILNCYFFDSSRQSYDCVAFCSQSYSNRSSDSRAGSGDYGHFNACWCFHCWRSQSIDWKWLFDRLECGIYTKCVLLLYYSTTCPWTDFLHFIYNFVIKKNHPVRFTTCLWKYLLLLSYYITVMIMVNAFT